MSPQRQARSDRAREKTGENQATGGKWQNRGEQINPDEPFTWASREEALNWAAAELAADRGRVKLADKIADQWATSEMATRGMELPGLTDINDLEDTDPVYLIADWLERGTTGFLCGTYGSAKSFLALDWACCIATGRKWGDLETTVGKVIYVAAEGAGGQAKRAKAWMQERENVPDGAVMMLKKPIQLGNSQHVDHLVGLVIDTSADLVIIDTLARSMVGLDESRDGAIVTAALDRIRDACGERMTAVLVVHHFGKDEKKGARGDSRFIADADFNHTTQKDNISGCITLHCNKLREDERPDDLGLRLRKVPLDKWGKRTSCVLQHVELATDDDELVAWIAQNSGLGTTAIYEARGGNRSNLSTKLNRLQREGRIRDEAKAKNRNFWVTVTPTVARNSEQTTAG